MLGPKMLAFLAVYAETGSLNKASELTGIARSSHYRALERSEEYRQAAQEAAQKYGANVAAVKGRITALVAPVLDFWGKHLENLAAGKPFAIDKGNYLLGKDILDRAGFKPKIEVEHSGQVALVVQRLQAARKRVQKAE